MVVYLVAELPSSHKDTKLRQDKMPRLSMRNVEGGTMNKGGQRPVEAKKVESSRAEKPVGCEPVAIGAYAYTPAGIRS